MFRVLLAEGEISAREALRGAVDWAELGFELIGDCGDGELALALLQEERPELLVTGLNLPGAEGMELCRRARRALPGLRIAIVSGRRDFDSAREAVALGARAYLTRPVDARALRAVLEDVAQELRGERQRRAREEALEAYLRSAGDYFQERMLEELFGGAEAQVVLCNARTVRLDLSARRYQVVLLRPEEGVGERALLELHGALMRVVRSGGAAFLRRCGVWFAMLVLGDDAAHLCVRAKGLVDAAQQEARQALGIELTAEFGEDVARLEDVAASFAGAVERMKRQYGAAWHSGGGISVRMPALDLPPLSEQLRYAAPGDAQRLVAERAEALDALNSQLLADYLCADVLLTAARIVRDGEGELIDVAPEALRVRERGGWMLPLCGDVLRKALEFRDERNPNRYGGMIRRARAYIDENFANPGLSLRDVAAHVALSTNHFCTVFSRETGTTFGEYLTNLRIRRAQELLRDSQLRTGEIAESVGYNDPHYFSNLFKKITGVSPRDYRRKNGVNEIRK